MCVILLFPQNRQLNNVVNNLKAYGSFQAWTKNKTSMKIEKKNHAEIENKSVKHGTLHIIFYDKLLVLNIIKK